VPREQTIRILAEMVANVIVVEVAVDDQIAAGDTVCLLESMKMEIPVLVEFGGVVAALGVREGDIVQEGDVMVDIA